MATLGELARLIRSKNAGPFELTFDIMFANQKSMNASEIPERSAAKSLPHITAYSRTT